MLQFKKILTVYYKIIIFCSMIFWLAFYVYIIFGDLSNV